MKYLILLLWCLNLFAAQNLDLEFIDGTKSSLKSFTEKGPVLVVNIATKCGYTPQLDDLEKLYKKYKDRGVTIIGVPSNDFGSQTPEENKEVAEFCRVKYGVSFPLLKKQEIAGNKKTKLYQWLIKNDPTKTGEIRWNFEKFLISKSGKIVQRFESSIKPLSGDITKSIEKEIN